MVLKQKVGNCGSKNRSSWEPDDWGQGCAAEGQRRDFRTQGPTKM